MLQEGIHSHLPLMGLLVRKFYSYIIHTFIFTTLNTGLRPQINDPSGGFVRVRSLSVTNAKDGSAVACAACPSGTASGSGEDQCGPCPPGTYSGK
jgi:hypothetical protein